MNIGNVEIVPPIMNAACSIAKTPEDIAAFSRTRIGAVVAGSITVKPRDGNPEPRYFKGDGFSLNSVGMPNPGLPYYEVNLPIMVDTAHEAGKAFILNVAGFSTDDYVRLAVLAEERGADIVELNLGCPNTEQSIPSFDPEYMDEIFAAVSAAVDIPVTVKLSPYSDFGQLEEVAGIINGYDKIAGVVSTNTIPRNFMTDRQGQPVLGANKVGGMSGRALQTFALGNVRAFKEFLSPDKVIIGVGGIESRRDVRKYKDAGASAVQAATVMIDRGGKHSAINRLSGFGLLH